MKTIMNLAMSLVLLASLGFAPGVALAAQKTVDERLEVPANVVVTIDNMRGEVELIATDEGYAAVKGKLDEYATGLTFDLDGNNLTIRVEMPDRGNFSGNEASELSIHLPLGAELHVNGVSSDFKLSGFVSAVRVNTVSGDINARDLRGELKLSSVSGDVTGEGLAGTINLKSVSGDIIDRDGDAESANYTSTSGDVEASTTARDVAAESVSGDVELDLRDISRLRVNSVSGDVQATLSLVNNGRIEASSVSGTVELIFAGAVNANLEADVSGGGEIVNRLNDAQARESEWGIGASLETKLGSGSGTIELSTMSGDIILRKK